MSAPAAAGPLSLSDDALMAGYRRAEQYVLNESVYVDKARAAAFMMDLSGGGYTDLGWEIPTEGSRYITHMDPHANAVVVHAMAAMTPAASVKDTALLGQSFCKLAAAVHRDHLFVQSFQGGFLRANVSDAIRDLLSYRYGMGSNWNTPAMRRMLLRVVPPTDMFSFLETPVDASAAALAADMSSTRIDEINRVSMERAMLGRTPGMHSDVVQLLAQHVAPTAVTQQRPLRLLTSEAQRVRDNERRARLAAQDANDPLVQAHRAAAAAAPTNTDVLDEIIAEFDDPDADTETLKRKLVALRASIKRRRR